MLERLMCILHGHKWECQGWERIDRYGELRRYTCLRCRKTIVTNDWYV